MGKVIQEKSFQFAVRIVNLCKYLQTEQKEYVLTRQLLRCGTSIGANVAESQQAQSRADFISAPTQKALQPGGKMALPPSSEQLED